MARKMYIDTISTILHFTFITYLLLHYVDSCFWSKKKNIYNLIKPPDEDCPLPFTKRNGLCTYISDGIYSFHKGRSICHGLEGFLAEPVHREEVDYLSHIKASAKVELRTKIALNSRGNYRYFNDENETLPQPPEQSNIRYWLGGSYLLALRDFSCDDFQNFAPMWPTGNRVIKKWARVPEKEHNCTKCSLLDLNREGLVTEECDERHYIICEFNSMHQYGIYSN